MARLEVLLLDLGLLYQGLLNRFRGLGYGCDSKPKRKKKRGGRKAADYCDGQALAICDREERGKRPMFARYPVTPSEAHAETCSRAVNSHLLSNFKGEAAHEKQTAESKQTL